MGKEKPSNTSNPRPSSDPSDMSYIQTIGLLREEDAKMFNQVRVQALKHHQDVFAGDAEYEKKRLIENIQMELVEVPTLALLINNLPSKDANESADQLNLELDNESGIYPPPEKNIAGYVRIDQIKKDQRKHRIRIRQLYIKKSFRGKGFSNLLMDNAIEYSKNNIVGGSQLEAAYVITNTTSRRIFTEKYGFTEVGTCPNWWMAKEDKPMDVTYCYKDLNPNAKPLPPLEWQKTTTTFDPALLSRNVPTMAGRARLVVERDFDDFMLQAMIADGNWLVPEAAAAATRNKVTPSGGNLSMEKYPPDRKILITYQLDHGSFGGVIEVERITKLKRKHRAKLRIIYVREPCRHHGIATRLVNSAVIETKKRWPGVTQLEAAFDVANVNLGKTFKKAGFYATGVGPNWWIDRNGNPHHLVYTWKNISPEEKTITVLTDDCLEKLAK
ncbi:GNAT family N-acetyltransferase [Candidatus Peregrinibacteria bacterium]|nr:GNAT family N-acetyltransferase [Candidatus Peregrinibacteria bacterium]